MGNEHETFDWPLAVKRYHEALLQVVSLLLASVGLKTGEIVETLPRYMRSQILLVLEPAESAVRRLIIMAARGLNAPVVHTQSGAEPNFDFAKLPTKATSDRMPSFALFDPLKRFDLYGRSRSKRSKIMPRIRVLEWFDPRVPLFRRIETPIIEPEPIKPMRDDLVDVRRIMRRLQALQNALDTLPKQARRLVRQQVKCKKAKKRNRPLRPGCPPGHRKRHKHPVDEVLSDCHSLAFWALEKPT